MANREMLGKHTNNGAMEDIAGDWIKRNPAKPKTRHSKIRGRQKKSLKINRRAFLQAQKGKKGE